MKRKKALKPGKFNATTRAIRTYCREAYPSISHSYSKSLFAFIHSSPPRAQSWIDGGASDVVWTKKNGATCDAASKSLRYSGRVCQQAV